MTMPTSQCPWRMQVHHIHQETPDVWTLSLLCHDYYPYRAGQYALVSVRNSAETLRAYTLSSTPGVSEYITLTVRRIDEGTGSHVSGIQLDALQPISRVDAENVLSAYGQRVFGNLAIVL